MYLLTKSFTFIELLDNKFIKFNDVAITFVIDATSYLVLFVTIV
jgi:hypothetical protein